MAIWAYSASAPTIATLFGLGVVASINRWALTPLAAHDPVKARRMLWWTLGVEQTLALALLATVAQLGLMNPGA